jgi:hypothetical protein
MFWSELHIAQNDFHKFKVLENAHFGLSPFLTPMIHLWSWCREILAGVEDLWLSGSDVWYQKDQLEWKSNDVHSLRIGVLHNANINPDSRIWKDSTMTELSSRFIFGSRWKTSCYPPILQPDVEFIYFGSIAKWKSSVTSPSGRETHGLCASVPIGCQIGELMVGMGTQFSLWFLNDANDRSQLVILHLS